MKFAFLAAPILLSSKARATDYNSVDEEDEFFPSPVIARTRLGAAIFL